MKATDEDLLLSNLFVTMIQRLGVETEIFANSTGCISEGLHDVLELFVAEATYVSANEGE